MACRERTVLNVKTCNFSSLHTHICSWSWKVDPTSPEAIGMLSVREACRSSQVAMTTTAEWQPWFKIAALLIVKTSFLRSADKKTPKT